MPCRVLLSASQLEPILSHPCTYALRCLCFSRSLKCMKWTKNSDPTTSRSPTIPASVHIHHFNIQAWIHLKSLPTHHFSKYLNDPVRTHLSGRPLLHLPLTHAILKGEGKAIPLTVSVPPILSCLIPLWTGLASITLWGQWPAWPASRTEESWGIAGTHALTGNQPDLKRTLSHPLFKPL